MIKAIAIDDEPLALNVIKALCKNVDFIELEKTFTKPGEALKHLRKFPVDLLFLDIQMPGMTGINLYQSVPQDTMVIFTTAFSEYAVQSYELSAVDYLLKPIRQERFLKAVQKAKEYYSYIHGTGTPSDRALFLRVNYELVKVNFDEIIYVEGLSDYLKIHLSSGQTIVPRMTMKEIAEKLPTSEFIRVHRSFIIPKARIQNIKSRSLNIPEREIPVGVTYAEELAKLFG
ncbi:MAG: response regulator transcription factor [Balneolaceae bacterium]|nr:response regulator transcription factor [Balneolaceae bacterium]MBO6545456.1 response regulator transcription factor [Balneolaceae bacterium]MBO6646852.1 response regulator transcription factor [Balneolaceae bacterium]